MGEGFNPEASGLGNKYRTDSAAQKPGFKLKSNRNDFGERNRSFMLP